MPTTFIIDKNSHLFKSNQLEKTEKRLKQYEQGIDKVVELNLSEIFFFLLVL